MLYLCALTGDGRSASLSFSFPGETSRNTAGMEAAKSKSNVVSLSSECPWQYPSQPGAYAALFNMCPSYFPPPGSAPGTALSSSQSLTQTSAQVSTKAQN